MSYLGQEFEHSEQPAWYQKKTPWIIAGVFLCLLAAGIGVLTYEGATRIPEVGGGVTIEADPDTKIYLGDKQVGTTQVSFTWEELFGDEKHNAIAIELLSPASAVTAEMVSGPGATILESQSGPGGSMGLNTIMRKSGFRYLIRRADEQLDQVEAIIIDWTAVNETPRRYLLPLRLRKGKGASTVFFNLSGTGSSSSGRAPSFMKAFGRPPEELKESWRFSAGSPPAKFAEEIKSKGLWEPAGNK
jgi:hypothetical protein